MFHVTLKFWFYFVRLLVLMFVFGALIWANIVQDFYKGYVIFIIMIISGAYILYLILDNIIFLFKNLSGNGRSPENKRDG